MVNSISIQREISWNNYVEALPFIYYLMAYCVLQIMLLIIVPGETWSPPEKNFPLYKLNGITCYIINLLIGFIYFERLHIIYENFHNIMIAGEIFAWILCIAVYIKSYLFRTKESVRFETDSWFYNFISGVEKHPAGCGYQLKQIFNCRYGMMGWSTIVIACASYQYNKFGLISNSMLVTMLLQLIYIGKFFVWEDGYFLSADIVHDNLGFYILWGVTYCVPSFYTMTSVYLADRPYDISEMYAAFLLILGTISIYMNYLADIQKYRTKYHKIGKSCILYNMKAKSWSVFCISGLWAYGRNIHYVPELLSCLMWSLPTGFHNPLDGIGYIYCIYLTILLLHRIHRLEESCSEKYGTGYEKYKQIVPYRLIPYIY
jgi:7-dehydrocholesterol reductase